MKACVNGMEIEGTPVEIAEFLAALNSRPVIQKTGSKSDTNSTIDLFVNEDVAFRALKRRSLSREQRLFLAKLASEHSKWASATDLQMATGYSKAQFAGLLGAFGKRVSSTVGYKAGTWFYEREWNYDKDCYQYRLPEHLVDVVERALK